MKCFQVCFFPILSNIYDLVMLPCTFLAVQSCDNLLAKDWHFDSLVRFVFLCFCHFSIWCPESGEIPDCNYSTAAFLIAVYSFSFICAPLFAVNSRSCAYSVLLSNNCNCVLYMCHHC